MFLLCVCIHNFWYLNFDTLGTNIQRSSLHNGNCAYWKLFVNQRLESRPCWKCHVSVDTTSYSLIIFYVNCFSWIYVCYLLCFIMFIIIEQGRWLPKCFGIELVLTYRKVELNYKFAFYLISSLPFSLICMERYCI